MTEEKMIKVSGVPYSVPASSVGKKYDGEKPSAWGWSLFFFASTKLDSRFLPRTASKQVAQEQEQEQEQDEIKPCAGGYLEC